MNESNKLGGLLAAFIFVVVAAVLISSLANSQTAVTSSFTVNNETAALINGTQVNLKNGIVTSVTSIVNATNASQSVAASNFTLTKPQGITLLNGQTGNFNVTYTYQNVTDPASTTMISLVVLFFALATLAGVLYYLSPTFRDLIGGLF